MYCIYCGTNNPEDAIFCENCGRQQNNADDGLFSHHALPGPPNTSISMEQKTPYPGIDFPSSTASQHKPSSGKKVVGRISRRAVITGLIGGIVVVVGGEVTFLVRSKNQPLSPPAYSTATPPPATATPPPATATPPSVFKDTTLYIYHGHSGTVYAVSWSPDGKRIASAGDDKTVQVWNAANGGKIFTYHGHSDAVFAVSWSPDGKRIASGSADKTVQVWDAANGGNVFTYRGHSDIVYAVSWSPDGKRIASAGDDKTVQVWDAANGGNVFTYRGHSNFVNTVAWSPDGKRIASGSYDGTVRVWPVI